MQDHSEDEGFAASAQETAKLMVLYYWFSAAEEFSRWAEANPTLADAEKDYERIADIPIARPYCDTKEIRIFNLRKIRFYNLVKETADAAALWGAPDNELFSKFVRCAEEFAGRYGSRYSFLLDFPDDTNTLMDKMISRMNRDQVNFWSYPYADWDNTLRIKLVEAKLLHPDNGGEFIKLFLDTTAFLLGRISDKVVMSEEFPRIEPEEAKRTMKGITMGVPMAQAMFVY
jgi:hypothetical protein